MKYIENVLIAMATTLLTVSGIFVLILLSTVLGALAGLVVGLVFGETILGILGQLGVQGIEMWQFGAFLGFTGSFVRSGK